MNDTLYTFYQFILNNSEIIGTLIGIPFFILLVFEKPIAFLFGAASSLFFVFTNWQLGYNSNALIMLYYFFIGVYGFYIWIFPKKDRAITDQKKQTEILAVSISPLKHTIIYLLIGVFMSIGFFMIISNKELTLGNILDSSTAGFAIIASYIQARKLLDNWFYWMIINGILVVMYFIANAYFYAGYSLFALAISFYGYYSWKKSMTINKNIN